MIDILSISCEINLWGMTQRLPDEQLTMVQVIV